MIPDSTPRSRRLAVAAVALALGAAGCGQPLDIEVQSPSSQQAPDVGDRRASGSPTDEAPTDDAPTDDAPTDDAPTDHAPADDAPAAEPATGQTTVLEEGDSGDAVVTLQERLAALGYWVGPTDGSYGDLTEQAVFAFQGWEGLDRDGRVGPETHAALDVASRPTPDVAGDLVEVHLDQQVLLVVEDGRTERVLHVSTGSGERYIQPSGREAVADTPVGDWAISWRIDGWRQSDLGRLWRPAYFHERGIAVHGYPEVPADPASHGCVRVSMAAMDMLWAAGHVGEGTRVVVS